MKGVFNKIIGQTDLSNKLEAWDELFDYIDCFDQWDSSYRSRLKEVLLLKNGKVWTTKEMNDLTCGKKCKCPRRTGLINWNSNSNKGSCSCSNNKFP